MGKTFSAWCCTNWSVIEKQIDYNRAKDTGVSVTVNILTENKIFYTTPAERMTHIESDVSMICGRISLVRAVHLVNKYGEEEKYSTNSYENIDLIFFDEIDRLKLQHLEQLRAIYD